MCASCVNGFTARAVYTNDVVIIIVCDKNEKSPMYVGTIPGIVI